MKPSRSSAFWSAVGVLTIAALTARAQEADLNVTVPEVTATEVASAIAKGMDFDRWNREFAGKVVKWSGVVIVPADGHSKWFERLYGQELVQVELKDLLCDLPVPNKAAHEKGSTLTFTGTLAGYSGNPNEKPIVILSPVKLHGPDR